MVTPMIKRKFIHPETGDVLTFSELISWKLQGLIRNWYFIIIWTIGSTLWWSFPTWFQDTHAFTKWQLVASWLAVTIELVIGIAMFGQTKRDALIIRELRKLTRREADDVAMIVDMIEDLQEVGDDDDL